MELVERIDDYGKAAWIALMVLAFIVFWPLGLALLFFIIWSGRMGCRHHRGERRWEDKARDFARKSWRRGQGMRPTGNRAFDEYREETLRKLEHERDEFMDFLNNLRKAKDKQEFDQFMDERKSRKDAPDMDDGGAAPGPA